jgi:integrase
MGSLDLKTKGEGRGVPFPDRFQFTADKLRQLTAPAGRQAMVRDTIEPALALRVGARSKTFLIYKKLRGRPVKVSLGRWPDLSIDHARKLARKELAKLADGIDSNEAKRKARQELVLGDLWDFYRRGHLIAAGKSLATADSAWRTWLARWEKRRLSTIKPADVQALRLDLLEKVTPSTAKRVLTQLRAVWNWGAETGLHALENPVRRLRGLRDQERDRYLQPDELPRLFEALATEENLRFRDFVLLALLSGARRSNVLRMRWEDLDLTHKHWRIPKTKGGKSQNVPIVPEAVAILQRRWSVRQSDVWVFPGRGACGHYQEPKRAWKSLLQRTSIEGLHIHDLRRSMGSWQARTGASLVAIKETLGHSSISTSAIYARLGSDPARAAMEKAADAMLEAGRVKPTADIVSMKR